MMTDIRKRYAVAGNGSLKANPEREMAIDILGAAGASSRSCESGSDVWKTAYGLERSAYFKLRHSLLRIFRERYPREAEAVRIVEQALHEYCSPECKNCDGTGLVGERRLDKPQAKCPVCDGSKIKKFSDTTRATMMKLSYGKTKHLAYKIGWVIKVLSGEDRRMHGLMTNELERQQ